MTQQILFIILCFLSVLAMALGYAMYFNIADMGKHLRSLGIPVSVFSIICAGLLMVMIDLVGGALLVAFGFGSLCINAMQICILKKAARENNLNNIHLYPEEFEVKGKEFNPYDFFENCKNIRKHSTIIQDKKEADLIMIPKSVLLDKKGEYKLLCSHIQNEGETPYWLCHEIQIIHRPFSLGRTVFRLCGFYLLISSILSFSIIGAINITGFQIDQASYEFISNQFGCGVGIGLFYAGTKIFQNQKFEKTLSTIFLYICIAAYIITVLSY